MVAVPSAGLDIPATWSALDAGLAAGAPLWRQGPFQRVMAASDSMDDLEHEIAESAESLDSLLQAVEALEPKSTPRSQQRLSSRLAVGVAGRKWAQAEAFADVLSTGRARRRLVLGQGPPRARALPPRLLQLGALPRARRGAVRLGCRVEHRPSHRFHGDRRARRRSAPAAAARLGLCAHGAARVRRACTRRALVTACRERARRIALVPCCYHKVGPEVFSPLSRRVAAESALLPLRTAELRLATAQTASPHARGGGARERAAVAAGDRRVAAGGARRGRVSERAVGAGAAAAHRRGLRRVL